MPAASLAWNVRRTRCRTARARTAATARSEGAPREHRRRRPLEGGRWRGPECGQQLPLEGGRWRGPECGQQLPPSRGHRLLQRRCQKPLRCDIPMCSAHAK
eukprot:352957-Chlamydomonas_euryale.AAC.1